LEARTAIRGSGISKSFVAVCAVVATMGLGVTAGVVAKNLSAPVGVPTHILQGQGGALQYSGHRGGVQAIDETLAPAYQQVDTRGVKAAPAAVGPDDRATTTLPAAISNLQVDNRGIIPGEAFAPSTLLTAPNSFLGPDAQERNSQLAASMRATNPHGYI
jgi:hypothetical protein